MSVELSNIRTDQSALAKELDISPALLYRWWKEFSNKKGSSFPEMVRLYLVQPSNSWLY
ncbi:hypothetical protein [Pedobacter sp. JCM 36344]|uniref:hypothetical protein n=1 Tax=Pedobacter sp. JCM 36344 TaxID=3374280 RepID=UPI00397C4F01